MFGITNCGGGGTTTSAWAYIGVTYPEGSTCTATNGTTTLNAQGTSGLYVFQIPQPSSTPETWTVSCTNGTKEKNVTVSITTQYQNAVVVLNYNRCPDGYQEVEYIEATGTSSYLNIGNNTPTIDEQIEIDFMMLNDTAHSVFGQSYGYLPVCGLCYGQNSKLSYYWNGSEQIESGATVGKYMSIVLNNVNHAIVENGTKISQTALSGNGYSQSRSFPLLGMFDVSSTYGVITCGTTRLYKYIKTNTSTNTIVNNLVPCRRTSDDKIGCYDLATDTFRSVTGTFTVGPDV